MVNPRNKLSKKSFIRPSQNLVNFDYADVASRQGYVIFQGFTDSSGSAHLSGDAIQSKDFYLSSAALAGTATEELASFETSTFNYAAIINGNVYFIFPMEVKPSGGGSGTANGTVQIDFYHNTTLLGSVESQQINDGTANDDPENVVLTLDVSKEKIKIGDTIKVVATAKGQSGGYAAVISIGCDPSSSGVAPIDTSVDTCSTTKFEVLVPFKIDI